MPSLIDALKPFANWALRLSLSATFLFHAWDKFDAWPSFPTWLAATAIVPAYPVPVAILVTVLEAVAGVGIIAGIFLGSTVTRLAALAVIPVMIGAIVRVHWPIGFNNIQITADGAMTFPGWEFNLALLAMAVYFVIAGNNDSEG